MFAALEYLTPSREDHVAAAGVRNMLRSAGVQVGQRLPRRIQPHQPSAMAHPVTRRAAGPRQGPLDLLTPVVAGQAAKSSRPVLPRYADAVRGCPHIPGATPLPARTYSGQDRLFTRRLRKSLQVSGYSGDPPGAGCKTVGSAYVGLNPTPAICHHQRKRPVSWVYPASRAVVVLCHPRSSLVRRRRCTTLVTDI